MATHSFAAADAFRPYYGLISALHQLLSLKVLGRMHCMLMDLLHGFEVLSTTEETLFKNVRFGKVHFMVRIVH